MQYVDLLSTSVQCPCLYNVRCTGTVQCTCPYNIHRTGLDQQASKLDIIFLSVNEDGESSYHTATELKAVVILEISQQSSKNKHGSEHTISIESKQVLPLTIPWKV